MEVFLSTYTPTQVGVHQIRLFLLQEIISRNMRVFPLLLSKKKMGDFGQFHQLVLTLENRTKAVGLGSTTIG